MGGGVNSFEPNVFVNITKTFSKKLAALEFYGNEMRPFPHSRSFEGVEHLACFRGTSVGLEMAEGFVAERILQVDR